MKTIMMLKICSELPDMYIMTAFIGSCFAGARASSHDFFNFNLSVSSVVGAFRVAFEEAALARWMHRDQSGSVKQKVV